MSGWMFVLVVMACSCTAFIVGAAWAGIFADQRYIRMLNKLRLDMENQRKDNKELEGYVMEVIKDKD